MAKKLYKNRVYHRNLKRRKKPFIKWKVAQEKKSVINQTLKNSVNVIIV